MKRLWLKRLSAAAMFLALALLIGAIAPMNPVRAADHPVFGQDYFLMGGSGNQTRLIGFDPSIAPSDGSDYVVWRGRITPLAPSSGGDYTLNIFLLPTTYPYSTVSSSTPSPVILRLRGAFKDIFWFRGSGATTIGTWEYGDTLDVVITVNAQAQTCAVNIKKDGVQIASHVEQSFTYTDYTFTSDGIGFLGITQNTGTSYIGSHLPEHWVDPDDNGDYYIRSPKVPAFHSMAFEIGDPLNGTARNQIDFKLKVDQAGSDGYIAFHAKDRIVAGSGSRMAAIRIAPNNRFQVLNGSSYVDTGISYAPGTEYRFNVAFNFSTYRYTVKINDSTVANNYSFNLGSTVQHDADGRNFGTNPDNVGIISVLSPNSPGFDMYGISVGINNLVDNDALRNTSQTNPVTDAYGKKTYFVGPQRKYQKPQDVISLLQPGDTVEIEGDCTYPAPIHMQQGSGAPSGTAGNPITLKGVKVNGRYPEIRSAGALNVIEVNASHWVLDGLVSQGHLKKAAALRGIDYDQIDTFNSAFISYRGIYYAGGDNLAIRNCLVRDSYQGIHCSGTAGNLLVEYTEVCRNGTDGYGHNLYLDSVVGATARIQYNYIHDTVAASNGLKSRAGRNEVYYNTFENNGQAIELIGVSGGSGTRDGDVVGNMIFTNDSSRRNGIRIGGDGTGPGSHGRYRIANNTLVMLFSQPSYFIRTYLSLECVEMYNNIFYSTSSGANAHILYDQGAVWVSGSPRIAGANNWVRQSNATGIPAQWTGTLQGSDPGFVNIAARDFTLTPSAPVINAGVPSTTLQAWPPFPGMRPQQTFINALTTLDKQPVDPLTMTAAPRYVKTYPDLGAYGRPN